MLLGKKGTISWPLSVTANIILGLFIFGVIVMIYLSFFSSSSSFASDWVCKTSVAISSGVFGLPGRLGLDTVYCYTDEVESDAKTAEEAKEDIAEYMRKCWNMWGEGKLNPEGKNIWAEGYEKCYTCYKLSFPELEEKVSMKEIEIYLQDEWDPKKPKLKGAGSYWNYFKQTNPNNFVSIILPVKDPGFVENDKERAKETSVIKNDEIYAVTYNEAVKPSTVLNLITSSTTGFVFGAAVCVVGTVSGIFTAPSLLVCGSVGAGVGVVSIQGLIQLQNVLNALIRKSPADGIFFMSYNAAKNNCVTVVKVKSKLEKND